MSSAAPDPADAYPLGRDLSASARLYMQHWMWRRELGYLIHPNIPTNSVALKIADIGCGTGIWLVDAAKALPPSSQLDGFDISTSQFPHSGWLPGNVSLNALNALAPIPAHLVGRYDVIHVGLLVTVAQGDPLPLLSNVLSMLKPGGYIQWDEADLDGLYRSSPVGGVPREAMDQLYAKIDHTFKPEGVSYAWARSLGSIMTQQHRMVVLVDDYHPIPDDLAHPWTCMHLMSVAELIKAIDKPPGTAKEWWTLHEEAIREAHQGSSIRMGMISVVARKQGES